MSSTSRELHSSTLALLMLCAAAATSGAQRADPRRGDIPTAHRGFLGVRLSDDSLASVKRRLGPTREWHTGDAGESEWWWCYRAGTGPDATVLLLSSGGEMGGRGHQLEEARLSRATRPDTLGSRCGVIRNGTAIATPGGLQLGLDRAAVVRLLGQPLAAGGDSMVYRWATEQLLSPTDPTYADWNARRTECFDGRAPFVNVGSGVTVRFDRRGASEIHLWRFDQSIC
jgi:hypothetical protein